MYRFTTLAILTALLALTASAVIDQAPFGLSTAQAQVQQPTPMTIIRIYDNATFDPPSAEHSPGRHLGFENWDTTSAHALECLQERSQGDVCPWTGQLYLPPAQLDARGQVVPTSVGILFPRPGVYFFRCAFHPDQVGHVVLGAPGRCAICP